MEVKARKKRELSAEPVGKTHRCISRYIRALGEKHETSTAFNSIHTSLAPVSLSRSLSRSPSFSLSILPPLSPPLLVLQKEKRKKGKKRFQKVTKHGALSVAVAVEVRKRRIRAHLQQRVKMM